MSAEDVHRSADTTHRGRLSIVATPIGHLEDITLRALRILKEADLVLAEDTRHSKKLLTHHGIHTPLRAFHAHSSEHQVEKVLSELKAGAHFALISDAGTPLVSDPGARLVAAAATEEIFVEPIPGPSAALAALCVAGVRMDGFTFVGFLPRSGKARRGALESIAMRKEASICFESPKRLATTLRDLQSYLDPSRQIAVCRELTKQHEQVVRGTIQELSQQFAEGARGEITLVIEGMDITQKPETTPEAIATRAAELHHEGCSTKESAKRLSAELDISRKVAYDAMLQAAKSKG